MTAYKIYQAIYMGVSVFILAMIIFDEIFKRKKRKLE
jgi:hypothetical protein